MSNNNIKKDNKLKDYDKIEARLKEIVEAVSADDISLDDSLDLYEEAVDLGMKASNVVEQNVLINHDTNKNQELEQQ